jgi:hypothetical protein
MRIPLLFLAMSSLFYSDSRILSTGFIAGGSY